MRKKLLAVVMCICLGMSISGCAKESSSKEDTTKAGESGTNAASSGNDLSSVVPSNPAYTEEDLIDDSVGVKALDYVELAGYTGLELTKEITEVTEEDVQSEMEKEKVALKAELAIVADGDTAVIDFTGKRDGVAFEGGTGSDYELVIGSGSFIAGFEDGLIDVKKGETVDLNLTFPENYTNTELAGKDVVFTVTVKDVKRKPELTDEWFQENTEYASLEEYKAQIRTQLETRADEDAQYMLETNALNTVVEGSTVKKYFKSLIEEGENQYENYFLTYASYYNMGLSDFLAANSMSEEDYVNTKSQQGVSYAQVAMVVDAIAEDAGLAVEDEGYQKILTDLAAGYNMDVDSLNTFYGEKMVYTSVMSEYVMEHLVKNANVETKTVSKNED